MWIDAILLVCYRMSRVPHNLKGLLRFCMDAGSDFQSEAEPMDPEVCDFVLFEYIILIRKCVNSRLLPFSAPDG